MLQFKKRFMDIKDLNKIITALEEHDILLKEAGQIMKNQIKKQNGGMLSMLFGTLGASLLSDLLSKELTGKGLYRTGGKGMYRTGQGLKKINSISLFDKF